MSHVAQCKVIVKSLTDLEAAAARLGGELKRNMKKVRWYGHFVDDSETWRGFFTPERAAEIAMMSREKRISIINDEMGRADHVITFPGTQYDIGVMQDKDGTFRLRWDQWNGGGGLNRFIGHDGGLIGQAYAVEAAKRAARKKGFLVKEEKQNNGHIKLRLLVQ